jgi:MBG domain-containing protein
MLLHGTVPPLTAHLGGLVNGDSAASLAPGPSCLTTGSSSSAVGTYPITCSGAGDPNYTIRYLPGTLTVTYRWSGFGQPINDPAAGSTVMSVFKAGSTISVKFQLKDANGVIVQAGSAPTFSVTAPQPCSDGAVDETASTVTADTGTSYRWDSTAQQYIYNDKTTSALSGMCQYIQATLDDGTTQSVYVGYK